MFDRLDFSHEGDLTIDEIIRRAKVIRPDADFDLLQKAYEFAELHHRPQKRSSGESYIIHPMNVAVTLIKLKMDMESIIAGILHDVVEDCDVTEDEIREQFGAGIADIVIGCTKISKIKFKSKEESQAENFRKMVVAMAKDIRVIIVKLADRMHNMLTLQYVSKEKQVKKAQETLDIYVPLASRLGINSVKGELEDLCLRFLHPEVYYRLAEKVAMKRSERDVYIKETVDLVKEKLAEYAVKGDVYGRPKHFYSIYKKMHNRGVDFEQIQDLLAFRIIVNNITECYKCLGIIHSHYTPVPGRFKDYIAIPKVNNYQSLHTTVIGPGAERIEIQIRTHEMHDVAERGVAAHWKYKEKGAKNLNKLAWVEELMEYDRDIKTSSEFMDVVKNDLDIGGIYIFTPDGDVKELRYGATPLDFAFAVHTEVGVKCTGAKVNGKMVPLKHRLRSGDTVEILTSKSQSPSKDWLKIAKTSRARTKIKQFLLKVERDHNRELGEQILEKGLKEVGTTLKILEKRNDFSKPFEKLKIKSLDELYQMLGSGKLKINALFEEIPSIDFSKSDEDEQKKQKNFDSLYKKLSNTAKKSTNRDNAVIVDGMDDIMVRMGKCCNPIPGDPIIGFITRGRGITVHTKACPRSQEVEESRKILVEWNSDYRFKHPVGIKVMAHDKPGILSRVSNNINSLGINIKSALAKSMPDLKGSFVFEIEVGDYSEFLKVVSIIESMEEVISVSRT